LKVSKNTYYCVKAGEVFSTNILPLIESNRQINKTVVIKVGDNTWAKILSKNEINAPNFVPLPDEIIEITPEELANIPTENNPTN